MFGGSGASLARGWLTRIGSTTADWVCERVFPWSCLVCHGSAANGPWCEDCLARLKSRVTPMCPRCANPVGPWSPADANCADCERRPPSFRRAIAIGTYDPPVRELCLALKSVRKAWLGRRLAELLIDVKGPELIEIAAKARFIAPVPLHWSRRLHRGYNQAEALALGLGKKLGLLPLPDGALTRVQRTPKLAFLSRTEREDVLRGAFRCRPFPELTRASVLLVDDIMTTGATCNSAARALKAAGAAECFVAVIARAGYRR